MSQYSETMGSFIRTGNYPLEANYIFATEAELKEFYSDPINATTLHKGLLKIVENGGDGKQALYWVVPKETNSDLEFVKLIENIDIDNIDTQLEELSTKLDEEIQDRKDSEDAIWGTTDPTTLPSDLNSLNDLQVALTALKAEVNSINEELTESDTSIKKQVKAVAGTSEDDVISYLKTLPYDSLTSVANALDSFLTETEEKTETIDTWAELQNFLKGYKDTDTLKDLLEQLWNKIEGSDVSPSEEFATLKDVEDFVRALKSTLEHTDENLQTELDQTQVGVGLSGDGSYSADKETYYLQDATSVMNALKTLDSLIHESIEKQEITVGVESNDIVPLSVRKELNSYIVSAKLLVSNVIGNDLIKKEDGIYLAFSSEYTDGILTLKVNDKVVGQHVLGLSSVVSDSYYDSTTEEIVIIFKLHDETTQTVRIPVGALIREWVVDNSTGVVELTREEVINGSDKLSADVRLSSNRNNILEKDGQTLLVLGVSSNITHNDTTLDVVISDIEESVKENTSNIASETSRATTKELELSNTINEEITRATKSEENIQNQLTIATERISTAESAITTEISRANTAETTLSKDLTAETERAKTVESTLSSKIESEATRATAVEEVLTTNITSNKEAIAAEIKRATDAEDANTASISAEVTRAKEAENTLNIALTTTDNKITNEVSRATNKENEIEHLIDDVKTSVSTIEAGVSTVTSGLSAEVERAKAAEQTITDTVTKVATDLDSEVTRAKTVESSLTHLIDDTNTTVNALSTTVEAVSGTVEEVKGTVTTVESGLAEEIVRAKAAEQSNADNIVTLTTEVAKKANIDSPTFTGIPQVETSPDDEDSSQRIPSTNWVNARITASIGTLDTDLSSHLTDFNNPHKVTAEQIDTYTKSTINDKLSTKADLVDGKLPEDQLPDSIIKWIDL